MPTKRARKQNVRKRSARRDEEARAGRGGAQQARQKGAGGAGAGQLPRRPARQPRHEQEGAALRHGPRRREAPEDAGQVRNQAKLWLQKWW